MEENSKMLKPAKKISERTTPEQLAVYVEFCAAHPQMQTGRNNPRSPHVQKELWDELATALNSNRGPIKTVAQWQETLTHWKCMVRARARKIAAESRATGGGPQKQGLSDLEERALDVFGRSTVYGHKAVMPLGFTRPPDIAGTSQSTQVDNPVAATTLEFTRPADIAGTSQSTQVDNPVAATTLEFTRPPDIPQGPLNLVAVESSDSDVEVDEAVYSTAPPRKRRRPHNEADEEALNFLKESTTSRHKLEERSIAVQEDTVKALRELAAGQRELAAGQREIGAAMRELAAGQQAIAAAIVALGQRNECTDRN